MKGLEISKEFYKKYGKAMLESEFSSVKKKIAVGLVGEGSECLGFDDEISKDHDFEAGFCLFLTKEDYEEFGFKLERAYSKLPKEFMGVKRSVVSAVGGSRHGVIVIDDFYNKFLGVNDIPNDLNWWLYTPSKSILSACNGEVFEDELGVFTKVRNKLINGYPEDVRRKKIAGHTIFMAQDGQYNFNRCLMRKEYGAAQLAIFGFVKNAISTIYLLNNKYEPFYKWVYKGLRGLPILSELETSLSALTEIENSTKTADDKLEIIEDISTMIINEFKKQGLTKATCNNLESHAYSILDGIKDNSLRNMHIMEGI